MTGLEGERIRGVTHALPPGKHVRWQGGPSGRALAIHAFHVRLLAGYFTVILGSWFLRYSGSMASPGTRQLFAAQVVLYTIVFAVALGYALLTSRMTTYAVTDRRVVMQVGIAFPMTINVPFTIIDSVNVRRFADGSGQIALQLSGPDRIAYLALWPNARPWYLRTPQPLLRALPSPDAVGTILQEALVAFDARPEAAARGDATVVPSAAPGKPMHNHAVLA